MAGQTRRSNSLNNVGHGSIKSGCVKYEAGIILLEPFLEAL